MQTRAVQTNSNYFHLGVNQQYSLQVYVFTMLTPRYLNIYCPPYCITLPNWLSWNRLRNLQTKQEYIPFPLLTHGHTETQYYEGKSILRNSPKLREGKTVKRRTRNIYTCKYISNTWIYFWVKCLNNPYLLVIKYECTCACVCASASLEMRVPTLKWVRCHPTCGVSFLRHFLCKM